MSVHIKQIKGANDLIARDEFVKNNLQGKMSLQDGNLILSVPLKIEKNSEGEVPDFSQLEEDDIVTKKYVDDSIANLKGEVSADYDTLKEIESKIKSISAATGAVPVSAQSNSNVGTKIGSISVGDDTINFYVDLSSYVQKSGINAAFNVAPTAPSISSAFDDEHLVTASFVHEIERKLIGVAENTLTTLSEISGAVDNDPDYYQKVRDALDNKLGKADISVEPATASGTLIGTIILNEDTYELKVDLSSLAPLNSPNFTGSPKVPDVAKGDKSSLIANTRFVSTAVSDAIASVKGSPPANLDTLQKISSAVGNNPTFATDINSSIGNINTSVGNLNTSVDTAISSISALDSGKQPLNAALTNISKLSTAADRMIYTTAKDKYAVTTLTGSARTLISKSTVADMRSHLEVPKADGTGASGSWSITADRAVNDKNGNPIDTTYLKTADAVNVTVTNTVTGTDVTRLGTITIGDTAHDINVDLSSYAPKNSPVLSGSPKSSTPSLTDNSTRIATTGFVQSVVSGAVSDLVGEGTPEALNTLKEISDVIGDNSDFTGAIISELGNKVSKVTGKGLSTNDFTDTLKDKLDHIAENANNYSLPNATTSAKGGVIVGTGLSVNNGKVSVAAATASAIGGIKLGNGVTTTTGGTVSIQSATASQNGLMTSSQASKLAGIAADAQVNNIDTIKINGSALTPDSNKAVDIDLTGYVQKSGTKVLSTNDYTTAEKNKLSDIATGATKNNVSLTAGASKASVNAAVTNPYINLTDSNVNKGSVQIKSDGAVTVSSSAAGVITVKSTDTTYNAGAGLSLSSGTFSADSAYLGSVQKGTDNNTFLRADGTWQTPPDTNTTYTAGTGISISSNKVNLAVAKSGTIGGVKVAAVATSNVSLSTDGGISVPLATTSQAGAVKVGTNLSVNNGTISLSSSNVTGALGFTPANSADVPAAATVMTGASASAAGKAGLVPVPAKGKQDAFLKGDGTWATVASNDTTYTAGTGISLSGTTFSAHSSYLGSIAKGTDTTKFLNNKGDWAVPPDTNTTYGAGTGISLSGTTFKADPNYLGSVQKGTGTTAYLRADGTWNTPPDTNTTYSAGNGLTVSSNSFSVKVPSNSGLSVTTNGVSVTAATGSAIGGVKIGTGISTGAGGLISIPAATAGTNGLMTAAQVKAVESLNGATSNSVSLVAANSATGTINATSAAGSTFVNLTDNKAVKGSIKIIGDGSVTVKSDTAGIVKISGTNTDTNDKVAQNISTANSTYPVLLSSTANATANVTASNVIFGSGVKINPSTNTLVLGESSLKPGYITLYNGSQIGVNKNTNQFAGLMIGDAHAVSPTVGSDVIVNGSQKLILGSGENVVKRYNSTLSSSIAGGFEENIIIASDANIIINTDCNDDKTGQTYSLSGGVFYSPKIQTQYINYGAVPIGDSLLATPINCNKGLIVSTPGQLTFANAGAIFSEIYATTYASLTAEELTAGKPHKVTGVSNDLRIRGSNALILQAGDGITPIGNYALPPTEPGEVKSIIEKNSSLRHYGFNWDGSLTDYRITSYHSGENMYLFADRNIVFSFNHQDNSTVPGTAYGLDDSIKVYTANKRAFLDYTNGYFCVRGIKTQKPIAVTYGGTGASMAADARTNLGLSDVATVATVPVSLGGTGATTASDALANLGVSTVSSDLALQAMGLGNGTGCYTCNISPTSATLTNDTTSPMTGFTLKDGATVYFCLKNTVSAATKAMLSFNGTLVHSAYSIKSGVSTSTVPASVLTTGFYKAIYHTSALSSSDANTWIFHKIN